MINTDYKLLKKRKKEKSLDLTFKSLTWETSLKYTHKERQHYYNIPFWL